MIDAKDKDTLSLLKQYTGIIAPKRILLYTGEHANVQFNKKENCLELVLDKDVFESNYDLTTLIQVADKGYELKHENGTTHVYSNGKKIAKKID